MLKKVPVTNQLSPTIGFQRWPPRVQRLCRSQFWGSQVRRSRAETAQKPRRSRRRRPPAKWS